MGTQPLTLADFSGMGWPVMLVWSQGLPRNLVKWTGSGRLVFANR